MGYKKPLIVEIYAELHLGAPQVAQGKLLELAAHLKGSLPNVEIGQANTLQINPALGKVTKTTTPRLRCWSADRKRLVQLSPEMVVINQVGEYLGWDVFEEHFRNVHKSLTAVQENVVVSSLSLNAIDKLTVPTASFKVGRYLACGGKFVPSYYAESGEACDLTLGRGVLGTDGFNRQVRIAVRVQETAVVQMNTTFHDRLASQKDVFPTLNRLHDESVATFEALITTETRNLMGGAT